MEAITVKEKLESMLVSNGISDIQAKEVMEMAMPLLDNELGIDEGEPIYKLTYDRPASEYPDFLYPILFRRLKPIALQWIDKNKPQAWFRDMFVIEEEPDAVEVECVPDPPEKKPIELSAKTKAMIGIGVMVAAVAGIAYMLYARPKREIKKYNCTPRTKKPRKARRQLRRRAQRVNPLSCRYRAPKVEQDLSLL